LSKVKTSENSEGDFDGQSLGEVMTTNNTEAFLAAEELYRCERIFILQPQRVVLDEQFKELRAENQHLLAVLAGSGRQDERDRIDGLLHKQLRLIGEFRRGIEAAGRIHEYTNYRSSY
jgi:hypothetical protein